MANKRKPIQLVLEMAYRPRTQFLRRMLNADAMLAPVYLDKCNEHGYYLGEMVLNGASFHVEAIEARRYTMRAGGGAQTVAARNPDYQNRIDSFIERNEELPTLVELQDGKSYFIHVEPFAQ